MYQTSARCRSALLANLLLLRCCMQVGCSTTNNCCNMLTANLGKVEISVGEWMLSSLNPCTLESTDQCRCFFTPSHSVGREVLTVLELGLDLGFQYKFWCRETCHSLQQFVSLVFRTCQVARVLNAGVTRE